MCTHSLFFKTNKQTKSVKSQIAPEYKSQSVFRFSREVKSCVPNIHRYISVIHICFVLDVLHNKYGYKSKEEDRKTGIIFGFSLEAWGNI